MRQELGALVLALRDYGPVRAWSEVQVTVLRAIRIFLNLRWGYALINPF